MAGSFDFLHIKRRTAGSSNELSFDVLEHKSDEASGKSRGSKLTKAPKATKTAFGGVGSTSTLSGQAEVEKRRRARLARHARVYALIALAVVVLAALAIYAGFRFQEERADVVDRMNDLVARLSDVDSALLEIDEMMADPFDADEADARATQLANMPELTTELNRVSVDAQSLLSLPIDERAEVTAGQLNTAAQTRNAMLSAAAEAFRLSEEAHNQVSRANAVWGAVLNADQDARNAISAANKATTQEATSEALNSIRASRDGFVSALGDLRDISETYEVDFSEQEAYLSKKIEALECAEETSEALLAGNREAAKAANDAYNAADAEAVSLAAALPPSIGNLVQKQFDLSMSSVTDRYQEARDRTVAADSIIREYLR